jgi:hypothetical protein
MAGAIFLDNKDPDNEGSTLLKKVGNQLPIDTVPYPRRTEPSKPS